MSDAPTTSQHTPSRRKVTAGLAWSVPAIAAVASAPLAAASPTTLDYRMRSLMGGSAGNQNGTSCSGTQLRPGDRRITALRLDNTGVGGTAPAGFAVAEFPMTDGSGAISPRTTATLPGPVQFVAAYPKALFAGVSNPTFTFSNRTGANWSAPVRTEVTMQSPRAGEVPERYYVFTFTWLGNRTQSTVANGTSTTNRTQAWSNTALTGSFNMTGATYCYRTGTVPTFYNYYTEGKASTLSNVEGQMGTFTTANGFTGYVRPLGWSVLG